MKKGRVDYIWTEIEKLRSSMDISIILTIKKHFHNFNILKLALVIKYFATLKRFLNLRNLLSNIFKIEFYYHKAVGHF